jgi:hypothetical protein
MHGCARRPRKCCFFNLPHPRGHSVPGVGCKWLYVCSNASPRGTARKRHSSHFHGTVSVASENRRQRNGRRRRASPATAQLSCAGLLPGCWATPHSRREIRNSEHREACGQTCKWRLSEHRWGAARHKAPLQPPRSMQHGTRREWRRQALGAHPDDEPPRATRVPRVAALAASAEGVCGAGERDQP